MAEAAEQLGRGSRRACRVRCSPATSWREPGNALTTRAFAARLEALAATASRSTSSAASGWRGKAWAGCWRSAAAVANPPRLAVLRWRGDARPGRWPSSARASASTPAASASSRPAAWRRCGRDMAGAAACAGAMLALALRRSPAPAVAVLALAENDRGAALPPRRRAATWARAARWRWSIPMPRAGWSWPMRCITRSASGRRRCSTSRP